MSYKFVLAGGKFMDYIYQKLDKENEEENN